MTKKIKKMHVTPKMPLKICPVFLLTMDAFPLPLKPMLSLKTRLNT